jgi:hypothetical protein
MPAIMPDRVTKLRMVTMRQMLGLPIAGYDPWSLVALGN